MSKVFAETEELAACPNCSSSRLKLWCKGHDRLHNLSTQTFNYSKCQDCGLIFMSLRPVENEAHKFYPENYGPYHAGDTVPDEVSSRNGVMGNLAQKSLGRVLRSVNYRTDKLFEDTTSDV